MELRRKADLERCHAFLLGVVADLGGNLPHRWRLLEHREGDGEALEGRPETHTLVETDVLRQVDPVPLGELPQCFCAEGSVEMTVKIGERRRSSDAPILWTVQRRGAIGVRFGPQA